MGWDSESSLSPLTHIFYLRKHFRAIWSHWRCWTKAAETSKWILNKHKVLKSNCRIQGDLGRPWYCVLDAARPSIPSGSSICPGWHPHAAHRVVLTPALEGDVGVWTATVCQEAVHTFDEGSLPTQKILLIPWWSLTFYHFLRVIRPDSFQRQGLVCRWTTR